MPAWDNADDFLRAIRPPLPPNTPFVIAVINTITATGVTVIFEGEGTDSLQVYRILKPYSPKVGDRVVMARIGRAYVAIGVIAAIDDDTWIDYTATFAWTASSANPVKGNSVWSARYTYLNRHTVKVVLNLALGTTFTAGTGTYSWSLPVTASDVSGFGTVGSIWINDSGVAIRTGTAIIATTTTIQGYIDGSPAPQIANTTQTFNSPDSLRIEITYEVP